MKKTKIKAFLSLLFLLTSCQGQDTLVYNASRIDSFTIKYYENIELTDTVTVTDETVVADFVARYENTAVWTLPENENDPNLKITYAHGYKRMYVMNVHLIKKGMFTTDTTFWMEFGYNETLDDYRFVTFSGYEYRYTNDYAESEKLYLDGIYDTFVVTVS